jgi:hypothetical protein
MTPEKSIDVWQLLQPCMQSWCITRTHKKTC